MEYQVVDPSEIIAALPSKPTVLIIDDSPTMLQIAEAIVSQRYAVVKAHSAAEALQQLKTHVIHILLTDLMMHDMSGLELIHKVKLSHPDIGLILMTGFSSKQTAIGALKEGVQDYLEKPLEPKTTLNAIAELWKLVRTRLENQKLVQALYKAHVVNLAHERTLDELNHRLQQMNRDMQQELQLAGQVQKTYLPKLGCKGWMNSDVFYKPHGQVSGDCYHLEQVDDDTYQYFLGDGTGHGVAAGFITILIAMALIIKTEREQPHQTLTRLNKMLTICTPPDKFMTTVCVQIQRDGECQIANAGHVETIFVPREGAAQLLKTEGMPLGLIDPPPVAYSSQSVQLKQGDRLYLYTDGITELQNPSGELFGLPRLLTFLERARRLSASDIVSALAGHLQQFYQNVHPADDMTLLVLEYIGDGVMQAEIGAAV